MGAARAHRARRAAGPRPVGRDDPALFLGAHMSIAGGVDRALERARESGCGALQIFTKSSSQWRARTLGPEEVAAFREGREALGTFPVIAHNSYLINLASPDDALWKRSIEAMVEELERCERLGVTGLVAHPGAHVGSGLEAGIERIARGLDAIHRRTPRLRARILLETTAGQGSVVGSRFEEIGAILGAVKRRRRLGVCFDTCHAHAAGYDLTSRRGWEHTWAAFQRHIGLERLEAFHVNDSRGERGSRLDRHASLGDGTMGLAPFRFLVNDARLAGRPMILETPKRGGPDEDRRNLATLRGLVRRRRGEAAGAAR